MALEPGSKLGSYEILAPLGAGGMGEVYRARDTKLNRDVAIKVLPAEVAEDDERLARFKREAQVLASLNHPHIAAIHGLEQDGERPFLVLELVEGETLAERLARGPLPVEEAVALAHQVAEAVEQAHDKNIVHRDLKPGNVMITPEGEVKVLDFGLAKAFAGDGEGPSAELSQSPTLSRQTAAGVILGTAAYMSPEQARGKTVDKRADIWAFGVVLFELLTGRKLYSGETISDTLASVLTKAPDWDRLPADTPVYLRRLLERCLEKDPRQRLRDIGEARIALDSTPEPEGPVEASAPAAWKAVLPWGLLLILGIVGAVVWPRGSAAPSSPVARLSMNIPGNGWFLQPNRPLIGISRDGALLAFPVGRYEQSELYVRHLDRSESRRIPETMGATQPFFSPDGQWLVFFQKGRMKKVAVEGGPVLDLAAAAAFGGTWAPDDTIYYSPSYDAGVWRISSAGGAPERVTEPNREENELGHWYPQVLPDGKSLLYNAYRSPIVKARVTVVSLETGERRVLLEGAFHARYASSGHLVYAGKDAVMAVPFDLSRLEVTGLPVPVLEDAYVNTPGGNTAFSFSENGTLVYARDEVVDPPRQLVWVDHEGNTTPVSDKLRSYSRPRLSPDGRRLAVTIFERGLGDVWIEDMELGTQTRISLGETDDASAVWAPDGQHLIYSSEREGPYQIYRKALDGRAPEEPLLEDRWDKHPNAVLPDGTVVAFQKLVETAEDIWMLPLTPDGAPVPFIETEFKETNAVFSPDARWLAYQSTESGRYEIYVVGYPDARARRQVSTDGGTSPLWDPDGRELYYRNGDKLMAVELETTAGFTAARPRTLFEAEFAFANNLRNYDIAPDGERFLMVQLPPEAAHAQLEVVVHWFEELRRLVPTE